MNIYKTEDGRRAVIGFYTDLLDQWPVDMRTFTVETSYGSTFVISSGDESKERIILIHGTGSNSASWMGDVEKYSKYYCVFCIDIPGEAGLSSEDRIKLNPYLYNRWLSEVMDNLGISGAHFIGQSLGGWIGLNFSTYSKERVKSLTLISPSGICAAKNGYILKFFLFSLLGEFGRKKIDSMLRDGMKLSEDAHQFILLTFKHFNFRRDVPELLTDPELESIEIPVLYVAGDNDPLLDSGKTANRLSKHLSNIEVDILHGGHVILNQTEKVLDFIGKI